ncbi:MAG: 5-oxoprolinase subunit PxpB, partial [Gemmatimonadales bacterium]
AIQGVTDVVPSYAALAVYYDPLSIGFDELRKLLIELTQGTTPLEDGVRVDATLHRIRVRYDGQDLEEVARRTGLSADEVARIHSGSDYRVFVIGFVPGFAYLGPLDSRLVIPRRDAPRKRVPAGSVAIAEAQTGIYPSETPGGWHLIGTTHARMFDPLRQPPALLRVGDKVRFELE